MSGRATTPPAQTRTRSTRSASREMSGSPAQTRRRGARNAGTEENEDVQPTATATRGKRGKKTAAATNLAPVEEDPDTGIDPQLESPGDISNVSGTTAVSSTSAQPGETDKSFDDVCYALPHLYEAAEDLLEVLAPDGATVDDIATIIDDLKVPGSPASTSLKRCEGSFINQLENLTEAQYINPVVFLRSVLKPRVIPEQDTSIWRPDDILYKTNLASVARRFAILERGSAETYEVLRDLDLKFPAFFASGFGPPERQRPSGNSELVQETSDLALMIRTQLFVAHLLKQKDADDFDPDEILNLVFFKGSNEAEPEVRGWKISQVGDEGPNLHDLEESTLRRVQRLRTHLQGSGEDVDLTALQEEFSWQAFQIAALEWVRERNYELNDALEIRGGARSVVKEMKRTFNASSTQASPAILRASQISPARRSLLAQTQPAPSKAAPKKASKMSSLSLLKSLGKGKIGAGYTGAQASTAPAAFEQDLQNGDADEYVPAAQLQDEEQEWHGPALDEYETPTDPQLLDAGIPDWTRTALVGALDRDKRNQENLNRPRTFNDPQAGAQRIDFGDGFSQATQSQRLASSALARSRNINGKRRAQDDDDDIEPSQDPGFQTDDRSIDYDGRRRLAPVPGGRAPVANMTGGTPRKRGRFATFGEELEEYAQGVPYTAGEPPEQGEFEEDRPISTGQQYRRAKALAREATKAASAKGLLARPTASQGDQGIGKGAGNPGKRKWSEEQEGKLIEYIEDYGCKWSEIKKIDDGTEDNILAQWSQVDLKDKAINIRVDLLKSRTPEPANFEYISLRQRDKDKLAAMGIEVPLPVPRR